MFISLQNSYVEILTPNVIVPGGGILGKWLGHESGDLIRGISTLLIKEIPESTLPLLPCENTVRRWSSMNKEAGSHQT